MSEENSPGGTLSAEDAEAMLLERSMPQEDETEEVEESEAEEMEVDEAEIDEDESDEVPEDESTDETDEVEDDTDEEIDAGELNKGYLRQADYTRKTQEIAQQKAALEAQREQFDAHAQQQLSQLEEAVKAFSVQTEVEPNWPELANTLDPKAYNAKRAEWEGKQSKVQQAKIIQQRISDEQYNVKRQQEHALLLDRIPEWRDPAVVKTETKEIVEVAARFGLTEAEVTGIMDHRQIEILRTLAVAERATKAAAKKQAKPRKKVNAAASPQKVDEREKAQREMSARFKKSGSADDAVAMLMARSA